MTASLRRRLRNLVGATLPPDLPVFDDNEPVRGDPASGGSLDGGYLRLGLALEDGPPGLGASLPRPGRLAITIAVPAGRGSTAGDALIEALNSGLSFGGGDGIRFGGLSVVPGRQIGQHWVIDAEIGFAVWPAIAAEKRKA